MGQKCANWGEIPNFFRQEKSGSGDEDEEEHNPLVEYGGKSRRLSTTSTLNIRRWSIAASSLALILLWLLPGLHMYKPGSGSVSSWRASSPSQSHVSPADELRRMAASVSLDLLLDTSEDPKLDIGPLCDVIDASIDAVGVRGLLREVFETHAFCRDVVEVAAERNVLPGLNTTFEEHHMNVRYTGLINEPPTGGNRAQCTGCLWWLRHYVGAAIADRLLRDGFLSLDGQRGEDQRITNAKSFMEELHDLQRRPDSDWSTVAGEHGFVWHMVAAMRPGLPDGYPADLLKEWCGIFVFAGIWQTNLDTDLGSTCRHAFGHAVYYAVLRGSENKTADEHYSARTQMRPHMYDTPDELKEKMWTICTNAPINWLSTKKCLLGSRHSITLLQKTNPPVEWLGGPGLQGPGEDFENIEMWHEANNGN